LLSSGESGHPAASFRALRHQSVFHHARLQVAADQTKDASRCAEPAATSNVVDPIEELLQVHVYHPAMPGLDMFPPDQSLDVTRWAKAKANPRIEDNVAATLIEAC
jgi:hypothetical protein